MKKPSNTTFIIFLILLAAGVYWNTLANDFVAGDRQFILRNSHIGDFHTVVSSLTSDYWGKLGGESFIYYRPLVIFSHFIDFRLYGLNPAGHHLSNIIIHAIATATVYVLFLALLSGNQWCALAGASLFALHPIHTHSVSYVMGRTDVLAAVFYLWGLILLMRGGRAGKSHLYMPALAGACFCYLLSLLCKEIAVTLPLVYILYRCCWNGEKSFWRERDCLIPMLFLLGTLGLYLAARTFAVGLNSHQSIPPHWYSPGQRSWLVAITLGFYLQKLFYPLRLCYYSNIVVPGSFVEDVLTSPLLWIGLGGMTSFFLALRFSPRGAFALGWIGLTLLPVLNIIMIPALAKENYLYLPSVGFCLLLTLALAAVVNRCDVIPAYRKTLACSTILMIGFLYSVATTARNGDYKDPLTFLESTLAHMPPLQLQHREDPRFFEPVKNFYTTYRNLGLLLQEANQPDRAIEAFNAALHFTPSYFSPRYAASVKTCLSVLLYKQARVAEAAAVLSEARPAADNPAMVESVLRAIAAEEQHPGVMLENQGP